LAEFESKMLPGTGLNPVVAPTAAPQISLLVVDDNREFRESLVVLLKRQGFSVRSAASRATARTAIEEQIFDAILADRELPDGDGVELLSACGDGMTELIVITGNGTVASAVDALKEGALDYLTKPIDPAKLKSTLANLTRTHALKKEVCALRSKLLSRGEFGPLVGRSSVMQPVYEQISRVAPTDAGVLIHGESGTGKEIVAQAIHAMSRRRDAKLLPVNCGAIAESLIESELFGHERGSFTGADKLHLGFFERAEQGTLFLDEISEMPPRLQVKLLRVLETSRIQRVGGTEEIAINVRVLAATNREPTRAIREGKLREDLYFRLAVFPIHLPPLRKRVGDVALLARHFLDLLNRAHGTKKEWAPGAAESLEKQEWKGNVRELKNAVYRAYILADDTLLEDAAAPTPPDQSLLLGSALGGRVGASIADVERTLIISTLEFTNSDKAAAAKILGISLKTLYSRLSHYRAATA
jgi:DNA-binding NtrC family response regulator